MRFQSPFQRDYAVRSTPRRPAESDDLLYSGWEPIRCSTYIQYACGQIGLLPCQSTRIRRL